MKTHYPHTRHTFKYLILFSCVIWILAVAFVTLPKLLEEALEDDAPKPVAIRTESNPAISLPTTPFRSTRVQIQHTSPSTAAMSTMNLSGPVSGIGITHFSSSATTKSYGGGINAPVYTSPMTHSAAILPSIAAIPSIQMVAPRLTMNATTPRTHAIRQGAPRRASGTPTQDPVGWFDVGGHIYGYDANGDICVDEHGNPILYDGDYDPISGTLITQGEAVDNPIGESWILLAMAALYMAWIMIKTRCQTTHTTIQHIMKHTRTYIIGLLLVLTGEAWGWDGLHLVGDPTDSWEKNGDVYYLNNASTGEGYIDVYTEHGDFFAFVQNQSGNMVRVNPATNGYHMNCSTGDGHFNVETEETKAFAAQYTGLTGLVRYYISQTGMNSNNRPWVWLRRPSIKIKHPWGGGEIWTYQTMTDLEDGTYSYIGAYGNNGCNIQYEENGKYSAEQWIAPIAITIIGSPSVGTECRFVWDAKTQHMTIVPTSGNALYTADATSNGAQNTTVRLIANTTLTGSVTYTYSVTLPGESQPSLLFSTSSPTCSYTCSELGSYTFHVTADNGANRSEANLTYNATPIRYYLRYSFENSAREYIEMTYNPVDGGYYYYQQSSEVGRPISSYNATYGGDAGKYACVDAKPLPTDDSSTSKHWLVIKNDNNLPNADDAVIFHYDPQTNEIWITAATTCYRIKADCDALGTFYSNVIYTTGKPVSLFISTGASLNWQESSTGLSDWDDIIGDIVMEPVANNGIYTTTPATLAQQNLTFTRDQSPICVYSAGVSDSVMTPFTSTTYYDHYNVSFLNKGTNIGATVGNATNSCISTIMPQYTLPIGANVRYEYDSQTNRFTRSMVGGSTYEQFLHFYPTQGTIQTTDNIAIDENAPLKMTDASDWVYYADVKVTSSTAEDVLATIYSHFNGTKRWILAPDGLKTHANAAITVMGHEHETASQTYTFRTTYDYKTNRLQCGWLVNSADKISADREVDANIIVTNKAYSDDPLSKPNVFTFANDVATVRVNGKVIYELEIEKDAIFPDGDGIGNKANLFQVTLPFEVNMTDIYGLESYGNKWVIEDYKGELRALLGYKQTTGIANVDPIDDYWGKLIWSNGTQLKPGRGYVIAHNFNATDFKSVQNGDELVATKRLYFPSAESGIVIRPTAQYSDTILKPLTCQKPGREQYDSDWRVIGVPGFYEAKASCDGFEFLYEWAGAKGAYTVRAISETTMKPTHNYMIQWHGTIDWSVPTSAPLRRTESNSRDVFQIVISNENDVLDQTYVVLSNQATREYEVGHDLLKVLSPSATQLYSIMPGCYLAANTLPDTTTFVALGVAIGEDDMATEHTIHLSEGQHNHSAILYDAVEETYTDLHTTDYNFIGNANGRFTLYFAPHAPNTATDVENLTSGQSHTAVKIYRNGGIIILKDGHEYTLTGQQR